MRNRWYRWLTWMPSWRRRKADEDLWRTCIALGIAAGGPAGLFIHWHGQAMIGFGMLAGLVAGIISFFLIRHRRKGLP